MEETTHHLVITGMTCPSCSTQVANVLNGHPGIVRAEVSHETDSGTVVTRDNVMLQEVVNIIQSPGFTVKA